MPDMQAPRPTPIRDWRDALSSLPLDTPDGDGWPRLAARLPIHGNAVDPPARRGTRQAGVAMPRRRRGWLAVAAVAGIASLALLPVLRVQDTIVEPSPSPTAPPGTVESAVPVAIAQPASVGQPVQGEAPPGIVAAVPAPRSGAGVAASSRPGGRIPTGIATATSIQEPVAPPVASAPAGIVPTGDAFDRLYDQSARLEALVAMARDDGMASATGAYMAAALEDRIGGIDASLAREDLLPDERLRLWGDRVDALRSLAATEISQRMIALHGDARGAVLVRVD